MTQENDASIEDILNSIKKFVLVEEENKTESQRYPDEPEKASPDKIVRLSPVEEIAGIRPNIDRIDMPGFIKNAIRANDAPYGDENDYHEPSVPDEGRTYEIPEELKRLIDGEPSKPVQQTTAPIVERENAVNKQGAQTILQDFANTVRELAQTKESIVKTEKTAGNLDRFVLDSIKMAVGQWVEQNIKQIVEALVREEIANITASIFAKSDRK
ncbi:MAG: DUF2497 domain-containing protein [Holosporales bacterium]|jgi:cell pole-organizing protein PopZ|nr:DUF2497 domain-containing protein [Holosporales bacterium]